MCDYNQYEVLFIVSFIDCVFWVIGYKFTVVLIDVYFAGLLRHFLIVCRGIFLRCFPSLFLRSFLVVHACALSL